MSGSNSSGTGAPRGRRSRAVTAARARRRRDRRRRAAASPGRRPTTGSPRRAAPDRRAAARAGSRITTPLRDAADVERARRGSPRPRRAATACRGRADRRRAPGAPRARRRAAGSRAGRRAAATRRVVTSTSASAPARSRPTSTPQQRRSASPALAVAIIPRSRASSAPSSASSFHSAATFSSPSRFFVPDGPQSEPRQTRWPWRRAASTSVVPPYSQMFENGDHTIAPGARRAQSRELGARRARSSGCRSGCGCTQPASRRSANSSRSAGAVPSARW